MDVERRHEYKIFSDGMYLGLLPYTESEFQYDQKMNTPGTEMIIVVGQTLDIAPEAVEYLETESGEIITTENDIPLTTESATRIIGTKDSGRLIANNNDIEVWEYSSYHPNGIVVFTGYISRWKSSFGGGNTTAITCISHGKDTDDYIYGNESYVLKISQTTTGSGFSMWGAKRYGSPFATIVGQTDLSKFVFRLRCGSAGDRTYTLRIWNSASDASIGATPLGTATVIVNNTSLAEIDFVFNTAIAVTASTTYFWSLEVDSGSVFGDMATWGAFDSSDTSTYANGSVYSSSGGAAWSVADANSDFWFKIYSGTILTDATFTTTDPSAMVEQSIDGYNSQGGIVQYTASSIDNTGLSLSYSFRMATVLEIIQKAREIAPSGWYWYVDPADQTLYFKATPITATHTFILGRHISALDIEASVEDIVNVVYVTGGPTAGVNLLKKYSDTVSLAANRIGMRKINDNRATTASIASALGEGLIDENSDEVFLSDPITIHADTYDITTIHPGDTVRIAGVGDFVDDLVLQVSQLRRRRNEATLTLGRLPIETSSFVEEIRRDLELQQTLANPTAPS